MSSPLVHRLPNGLTLLVTEQAHLHAVAISYTVRCGSRHDPARKPGLSHLLEHMMFRGSRKFPSAKDLIAPFERAGGTLSAETWRDHTHFSTTIHPTKLTSVITALGDMMSAPAFLDLEAERALVQAELAADLDEDGFDTDTCNASRATVWPHHPLGRRIVGTEDAVAVMTLKDVRQHYERFYGAHNAVISIAGCVDAKKALQTVTRAFKNLFPGRKTSKPKSPSFAPAHPLNALNASGSQASLALTLPVLAESDPDFVALELLSSILDDGMGSRLHRALSERHGLVYDYESGLDCYSDAGLYELEMQVSPERAVAAFHAALEVFESIAQSGVTATELREAKVRARISHEMGQDNCEDIAHQKALDALFNRASDTEWHTRLKNVKLHDIQILASRLFGGQKAHLMIIGSLQKLPLLALKERLHAFLAKTSTCAPKAVRRKRAVRIRRSGGHAATTKRPAVAAPIPKTH